MQPASAAGSCHNSCPNLTTAGHICQ
jgi:hypothetical protein